ncbi:type II toxin-antitoxin system mRNA interferase toxin, RelE/StbE family [Cyanobacterium aponinum UTEX 3221]|uniref:type II toxin-antitoxin system RelE/ParE family toxin n=1 Tax=Cyanobacterium aponinum TaxID=379064 RepID=UPI002B4BD679|nr:type II toxin-antitoxin system mRNA interferase toxin, RelE/StbE family [Cyanobacterium aponinum]WRL38908.1 type II toxin-antitoxin system mRNA interferase toxin, RelE/StbE family [Cyanobacterium aponinum UTEX 3221]
MLEISFDESFKRAYKKRIKGNINLEQKFRNKLEIFKNNPFDSRLKTHKLSGKLKDLWSFSIEYDQRVVFYFIDLDQIVFIDIGNHDQVY